MHGDLCAGGGGHGCAHLLAILEGAGDDAPLACGLGAACAAVGDGDGEGLDQVAAAGAHAGPECEVAGLGGVGGGEDEGGVGLADEGVGSGGTGREGIGELPAVVGGDEGEEGEESEGGVGGLHLESGLKSGVK